MKERPPPITVARCKKISDIIMGCLEDNCREWNKGKCPFNGFNYKGEK